MITSSLLLVAFLAGQNILCFGFSLRKSITATSLHGHRPSCRLYMSSTTSSWEKFTVPELKSQLKEWNLPVSGTKAELIRRLTEHETSLDSDSESDLDAPQETINTNKKSPFPPPKDESEIRSMEKEVSETIRMLESLKLSGAKLNRQQKQQKQFMEKMISQGMIYKAPVSLENLTPEQMARAELLQHHTEELRKRPANALKEELASLRLSTKGRKPEMVSRLAEYYVMQEMGESEDQPDDLTPEIILPKATNSNAEGVSVPFAGIPRLSTAASNALCQAFCSGDNSKYPKPTPIQSVAIPKLFYGASAILHAPTGSGKTLTFLLPITEHLWREVNDGKVDPNVLENGMAMILLPTRELAAQVAGVATVLAPPGMVRFIPHPMDLMKKGEIDAGADFAYYEKHSEEAGGSEKFGKRYSPRILVGSAKSLSISLFGDGKMPGTPTRKPDGKRLLMNVRWLVMDEVDRLLDVKQTRTDKKSRHEKPAALVAAAVARLTVGRAQVIAASATTGRPLRRELSRVLGLHSSECPETLRGDDDASRFEAKMQSDKHVGRAVKIPDTVKNYVLPVGDSTSGSLLTAAALASKSMMRTPSDSWEESNKKVLVVLTRNCDIKVHNAVGALRHFGIRPEPKSLLDALEADGSDRLMEAHRRVSGVVGVGGSKQNINDEGKGYLLITHEDNVRGLHLDSLDAVVVVGRPGSPDEYTHIAGRTGRAGRKGSVLNIVSYEQAAGLASWNKMLGVEFFPIDESEIAGILDE